MKMSSETFDVAESSPKKQKLDEEKTLEDSPEHEDPYDEYVKSILSVLDTEELKEKFLLYQKQMADSDGFDLQVVLCDPRLLGVHVPLDRSNEFIFNSVKKCANHAISEYNRLMKTEPKLELVDIVHAVYTGASTFNFSITLEAKDTVSGLSHIYQTEMFYTAPLDAPELCLFRMKDRKDQQEGIIFPADEDDLEDYERIKKCAEFAITEYNVEHQGNFQFVKIVNAGFPGTEHRRIYHITLQAKDTSTDQIDSFYAVVQYNYGEGGYLFLDSMELKA